MNLFDKEQLSNLLTKAKGERSLNQYALSSGVDAGYLSRLINKTRKNPPSPEILKKLATKAHNNVKYEELMIAAGHLDVYTITEENLDKLDSFIPLILESIEEIIDKSQYKNLPSIKSFYDLLNEKERAQFLQNFINKITHDKKTDELYIDLSVLDNESSKPKKHTDFSTSHSEFTLEELEILKQIKQDPEISVLFHDLKGAPKKKIKQLLKTWDFVKEQFDNWEDEE
ncbi:hypothetical protein Amet_2387 [Alkaliphilus metalliredigens QYMF]|uniref:Uncharacterized protein n=1 Tax=Alkaliphilus metalliredigens (strain QYMF) TaxID=293826 RepID=A6TQS3_ALKMQ|nr:hypothetical protein [Alkaliphilus metalliredigens]ABR48541.1 hypothetical protein Amet_2387 [Alkaliphilus metalliredigens QYMF]